MELRQERKLRSDGEGVVVRDERYLLTKNGRD